MEFKENIEEKMKERKYVREIEISLIYVNAIESNVTADLSFPTMLPTFLTSFQIKDLMTEYWSIAS